MILLIATAAVLFTFSLLILVFNVLTDPEEQNQQNVKNSSVNLIVVQLPVNHRKCANYYFTMPPFSSKIMICKFPSCHLH